MADYREISQVYAQKGIGAAFLLNGGAAVAMISQAIGLKSAGLGTFVSAALLLWAAGTLAAAFTWVLAFGSTRYVDKSEREPTFEKVHLEKSDSFMAIGLGSVLLSLLLFACGCIVLAIGFLR